MKSVLRKSKLPLKSKGNGRDKSDCIIKCDSFQNFLSNGNVKEADLILTDPPYTISRKTGFSNVGKKGVERFAVSMDFGKWDHEIIDLDSLAALSFKALRKGGTAIIFYDLWKITPLAEALTRAGFKMIRLVMWEKTNPVPLNSKRSYLSNSREIAVYCVKGGKPTFHGEYDNGIYKYPIPREKRFHPTQKPIKLFRDLVLKHSNPGDLIVDPFLGSGTTAVAALNEKRRFAGCEIDKSYVIKAKRRVKNGANNTS